MKFPFKLFAPILIFSVNVCLSQGQILNSSYLTSKYSLERISVDGINANGILPGLPPAPGKIEGDPFLTKTFNTGDYLMYNNSVIKNTPGKLNVQNNDMYFYTQHGVKVIDAKQIKSFSYYDSITHQQSFFINAKEFRIENDKPLIGFFEVVYDGQFALLKKYFVTIKKSDYNVALDVGNRNDQIIKQSEYYYLSQGKAIAYKKKLGTKIFADQKDKIDQYIKSHGLNIRNEKDLKIVFEFYNSLI